MELQASPLKEATLELYGTIFDAALRLYETDPSLFSSKLLIDLAVTVKDLNIN